MTRPVALALVAALAAPAAADPPVAVYVFPAGGQRGTTVRAAVGGLHLTESCGFEVVGRSIAFPLVVRRTASPWFEGPLLPLPESQQAEDYPKAMAAELRIAAEAEPGVRHLRMWTAQGVTLPLKFAVGEWPEVTEDEAAGGPTAVQTPVTANGRIFPRENVDVWAVSLRAGQTLTCSLDAAGLGSPLQGHLEVRTPDGRLLADPGPQLRPDPVLHFTAPADGTYHVHVRDAGSKGGPAYVYRLNLTTGPWVDHVFPLGGRRGETVPVQAAGAGVPGSPVAVAIPADAAGDSFATRVAGPAGNLVRVDVDDLPEVLGPPADGRVLDVPVVGNGRIIRPGGRDRWTFRAAKGVPLDVELRAARLGSPLLGVLTLTDEAGKELARAEAGGEYTDPALRFVPPADGRYVVTVRDLFRGRGGPAFAYRLKIAGPPPGFDLSVPPAASSLAVPRGGQVTLKVTATRVGGFTGPIDLRVDGLPPGVTAPGPLTLAPNQTALDITLKADAVAPVRCTEVRVTGTGWHPSPLPPAVVPIRRTATVPTAPGEAPLDHVRVAVAVPTPFKIAGDYSLALHPRGSRYGKKYRVERKGYDGPIEVTLAERQARHLQGVTGPTVVVPAGRSEFEYPVDLPPWMETGRTCRVCVLGTGRVRDPDGTEHAVSYSSREQNDQVIAVVETGRLVLDLAVATAPATAGGTVRVPFEVKRAKNLAGPVRVAVASLPHGVAADPLEVPADAARGELVLRFSPMNLGPFPRPLTVRATLTTLDGPVNAEATLELVPR